MNINLEYIMQFEPCKEGVLEYKSAGHENFNGNVLEFLNLDGISISNKLWVVLREEFIPVNDLYELACKFAESVLHIYEQKYPNDNRPRKAIESKRAFIKGEITKEKLDAARDAARAAGAAAWDAGAAAWDAAGAAWDAAGAAWDAAWAAARAAGAAAWDAAGDAARDYEEQKQLDIIVEYFIQSKGIQ